MIRKISLLIVMVNPLHGALREILLKHAARERSGSLDGGIHKSAQEEAPITPLSPMEPVQRISLDLEAKMLQFNDKVQIRTNKDRFLEAVDSNNYLRIIKFANKTLLMALYPYHGCREPASIRALRRGKLASFEALIDSGIDLKWPDTNMCTVDMYVYMYSFKGKSRPREILDSRHKFLERVIPHDINQRNVIWHLINNFKDFDKKSYEFLLFKIKALREYGVSGVEPDVHGESALDLAKRVCADQPAILAALQ